MAPSGDYIAYRLRIAGASREIFTPAACELVYSASRGLPRVINQICDYALVYAFADSLRVVDADLVRQVVQDKKIQMIDSPLPPQSLMLAIRRKLDSKDTQGQMTDVKREGPQDQWKYIQDRSSISSLAEGGLAHHAGRQDSVETRNPHT